MGIVRFALRLPHTFYVLAALVLFLGATAVLSMPTDIFPEIDIPVVTVIWQYTGLSTPEMEQRVTTYGQYALSTSVNGIRDIEAQTINGISVQRVFFQPDVNLDLAISQIVSATNFIRLLMPPGIQAPVVVQYNASSVPVLQIGLSYLARYGEPRHPTDLERDHRVVNIFSRQRWQATVARLHAGRGDTRNRGPICGRLQRRERLRRRHRC